MVLLLSGELTAQDGGEAVTLAAAVRTLVQSGLDEKDALKQVAKERGIGKSEAYREWQRTKGKR